MKQNHDAMPLLEAMRDYDERQVIPFDVPGHKHGRGAKELVDFFGSKVMRLDVNSMQCLDNLAHPFGVIKQASALMADAYGASEAFFLTNGTSSGVQAMLLSVCEPGDKVIMPRNAHKSALNALILGGITPVYVQPKTDPVLGISLGMPVEQVREAIALHPDAKAVFVINPTYYGAVSDLRAISDLAHAHDMAVLVDEAHGAHLAFHPQLPLSAMACQADMSAVSLHKTGGSLTQSSALLLQGERIHKEKVQKILNLTTSTSASYLLMASLDAARSMLATRGEQMLGEVLSLSRQARAQINQIPGLYAFGKERIDGSGVFDFDESKLGICVSGLGMSGFEVYNRLRDDYNIQMELGDLYNVLAIVSLGDFAEPLQKLVAALTDLAGRAKRACVLPQAVFDLGSPEVVIDPRDAFYMEKKPVQLSQAAGQISGESVMAYPPGIPVVAPGERITEEIISYLQELSRHPNCITDVADPTLQTLKVLRYNHVRALSDIG